MSKYFLRWAGFVGAFGTLMWACGSSGDVEFADGGDGGHGPFGHVDCDQACGSGKCDAQMGCVQCLGDGDCGGDTPTCVAGDCEECGDNADCADGQACHQDEHVCGTPCQSNVDCEGGDANICDTSSGACVECLTPSDCGEAPFCDPTLGCAECLQDTDCGAAEPICDLSDGDCQQCLFDEHCPEGQTCNDHECHQAPEPCTSDGGCGGETPHCDVATGSCQGCLTDEHCAGTDNPYCSPGLSCVECTTSDHCDGEPCENFECGGG